MAFLCQIEEDPNVIKENYEEYIVEFSVTIVDPTYSKLLSDPEAPLHTDVARELREKVGARWRPTANDSGRPELSASPLYKQRKPLGNKCVI